jgi:AAA+ ATPase superfamily predicted ATPase
VGRTRELTQLGEQLEIVRRGGRDAQGVAVLMRGRRRIGKSRLAEVFTERSGLPHLVFQAARSSTPERAYADLAAAIAASSLPNAVIAAGQEPRSLTAALTLLAGALPADQLAVVVLDELPWLLDVVPGGAGELQRVWDQHLSRRPVLMLLLGSDLAMMEHLTKPDQPFHGRGTEMVLRALTPGEVGSMTGLAGMEAFDAYLITGGQPQIAETWHEGEDRASFLARSFSTSLSALVASGSRVLDGELPEGVQARTVLKAIGGYGERTFSGIQQATGGMQPTSLSRALDLLITKRIVAVDQPLSTKAQKEPRYRVDDPALRFWLPFVEPAVPEVDRGREDLALARVNEDAFSSWRGRAIEPVVRASLWRVLVGTPWAHVREIGGWWPRSNNPEIDLVGADRRPAGELGFVGTIKWRRAPVTAADVRKLGADAVAIPGYGAGTPLVAVCPGGATRDAGVEHVWTADDLLDAAR